MGSTRGDIAAPAGWGADGPRTLAGRGLRAPGLMAGIQYSTAWTDATDALSIPSSLLANRVAPPRHPLPHPADPRSGHEPAINGRAAAPKSAAQVNSFTRLTRRERYDIGAMPRRNPCPVLVLLLSLRRSFRPRSRSYGCSACWALHSDHSDDRAGASGLGAGSHRMTSSIFMASFAASTA